jgi:hypothetical protein
MALSLSPSITIRANGQYRTQVVGKGDVAGLFLKISEGLAKPNAAIEVCY